MNQITFQDKEEARKIFRGESKTFVFTKDGNLYMPDGKRPTHAYSQKHRSIQAAVVDMLLVCDPEGDRFTVDAKEALTDQMRDIVESLGDMSDDHPVDTLTYLDEDIRRAGGQANEEDTKRWLEGWADVLRCEKKHGKEENIAPIGQYRNQCPHAFAFFDKYKTQIEKRAVEKEKEFSFREKYAGMPDELRASDGFWDSVRITIQAEPALLEKVRKTLGGKAK